MSLRQYENDFSGVVKILVQSLCLRNRLLEVEYRKTIFFMCSVLQVWINRWNYAIILFSSIFIRTILNSNTSKLSFRQSIDLYSSVASPSINFLGTPILSRLSGSFISSSLSRRHTPEILPSLGKQLLPSQADEEPPQQRKSSHSLLPPLPRRSFLKKTDDQKTSKVSHGIPISRQSSFSQAVVNGMSEEMI